MKNIILIPFLILCAAGAHSQSQNSSYRIYGEITTVENQTFRGYITWAETKNYWIDFFEAQKIGNPYSDHFSKGDGVVFINNNQAFSIPPTHIFCCRFGNISKIRLTGENEIRLQFKDGRDIRLQKGSSRDIGHNVQLATEKETIRLKWEQISEIHFMPADTTGATSGINGAIAVVKSPQGLYKGLVTWNYDNKYAAEKNNTINILLNKIDKIIRERSVFTVMADKNAYAHPTSPLNTEDLYPIVNILINMPNIGAVTVPHDKLEELEMLPPNAISLLTYDDFPSPQPLKGEVTTHTGEKMSGTLAYDLDEAFDYETLEGKNDNIDYKIPFRYIRSIEPKNYKYSFITLRNGSQLSLGDTADVNRENSGVIVFRENQIPMYIPWEEIKIVTLQ